MCKVYMSSKTHHDLSSLEYFHFLSEILECLRNKNREFFKIQKKKKSLPISTEINPTRWLKS